MQLCWIHKNIGNTFFLYFLLNKSRKQAYGECKSTGKCQNDLATVLHLTLVPIMMKTYITITTFHIAIWLCSYRYMSRVIGQHNIQVEILFTQKKNFTCTFARFGLLWLFGPFAWFWAFFGSGLVLSGALNSVQNSQIYRSCNTGGIGLDWMGWDIFWTTTTTRAPAVLKSCSIFLSCTCQCLQSSILLTSCVG